MSDLESYICLDVYVQPGAKQQKICGLHNHRLKVMARARAMERKANGELLEVLSQAVKVKKSQISLKSGAHSRFKRLLIAGDAERVRSCLKELGI